MAQQNDNKAVDANHCGPTIKLEIDFPTDVSFDEMGWLIAEKNWIRGKIRIKIYNSNGVEVEEKEPKVLASLRKFPLIVERMLTTNDPSLYSKDKLDKLVRVIRKWDYLHKGAQYHEDLIVDAYMINKPLSNIEIYEENKGEVMNFVDELKEFFYVCYDEMDWNDLRDIRETFSADEFNGSVSMSRFKTIIDIVEEIGTLSDRYADLAGIFYGYRLHDVAKYCQQLPQMKLLRL